MTDWRVLARMLADDLSAKGVLADPAWRAAFEQVPRHVFVPGYYRDALAFVSGDDPGHHESWLREVYEDVSLVTQNAPVPGVDLVIPTSSSTQPSLMARMLHLLDVGDRHQVLEIGTGTGYNAGLLCHRVGDARVASMDIDPRLVRSARARLDAIGYRPVLVTGTGTDGIPEQAPYERIIVTCGISSVPARWITQLAPDGVIVANLRSEISSTLVRLRKISDDAVDGRFLHTRGSFMWLRARADNPLREGGVYNTTINIDDSRHSTSLLDPMALEDPGLRFLVQWRLPGIRSLYRDERGWLQIRGASGLIQADTTPCNGRYRVIESGRGSSWKVIEETAGWWRDHGSPAASRFGLTATVRGAHVVWLDTPDVVFDVITG